MKKLFVMKTWKEKPMWQCSQCEWNTLRGEAAMMEHIQQRHSARPEAAEKPEPIIQTYSRFGNPL